MNPSDNVTNLESDTDMATEGLPSTILEAPTDLPKVPHEIKGKKSKENEMNNGGVKVLGSPRSSPSSPAKLKPLITDTYEELPCDKVFDGTKKTTATTDKDQSARVKTTGSRATEEVTKLFKSVYCVPPHRRPDSLPATNGQSKPQPSTVRCIVYH